MTQHRTRAHRVNPVIRGALLAAVATSLACTSTITGNEGNFTFSYAADDALLDFNKPVAVGARLDLLVASADDNLPVSLTDAGTDDPAVMVVAEYGGASLTLEGTGEGNVLVEVAGTTVGGEELTDSINMNAAVPEVHQLIHTCDRQGERAAYLTDEEILVEFEFQRSNGSPIIGYGYYPITLSGSAVTLDADASGQLWMHLQTGSTPEEVTMTSDIDGTSRTLVVVDEGSIDGAIEPLGIVWEDIDVGDTNAFYVLPTVGGDIVCQAQTPMNATSLTPDICEVRDTDPDPDSEEWGWFSITGVAEGTCEYEVTYTAGNGGTGASATFTFPIQP